MSWIFLLLFLLGGDFSAPERLVDGTSWLESRVHQSSQAGLAETVTNAAARLDLRLAALRELDRRAPGLAGHCARRLPKDADPVLRAAAADILGEVPPTGDDLLWRESLRAMHAEGNLSLIMDYRQATNQVGMAEILTNLGNQGLVEILKRGSEQLFSVLHFARMRRYALTVATNAEGQADGGLLVAEGAFSFPAFLQLVADSGSTNEIETRGDWKVYATPMAVLALRDGWLVVGLGNSEEVMRQHLDSWFTRLRDSTGQADWLAKKALIDGGFVLRLTGGAVQSVFSSLAGKTLGQGCLELRLWSLRTGQFELRLTLPEGQASDLAQRLREEIGRLPAKVPGLEGAAGKWILGLQIEQSGQDLVVRPVGSYNLVRFLRAVLASQP